MKNKFFLFFLGCGQRLSYDIIINEGENMKKVTINDKNYELVKDYRDGFDLTLVSEKLTDYFDDYDYILGDWAYGKLRLKGFCDKSNKNFKPINDYAKIDDYIKDDCAYNCRYFILKKID